MISSADARLVAAALAEARGWPFDEPVQVRRRTPWIFGKPCWAVLTNADQLGSNVRVEIDAASGVVLSCAFNPR